MSTYDGQPLMPVFWFRWRYDIPFFVLCLGMAGFAYVKGSWFPGVTALLLAGSVPVQGHDSLGRALCPIGRPLSDQSSPSLSGPLKDGERLGL